jgi:hypothetical protein
MGFNTETYLTARDRAWLHLVQQDSAGAARI